MIANLADAQIVIEEQAETIKVLRKQKQTLQDKLDKAKEGLRFYAENKNIYNKNFRIPVMNENIGTGVERSGGYPVGDKYEGGYYFAQQILQEIE